MPDNPNARTVLQLAAEYKAALERRDVAAMNRLIKAYNDAYKRIKADLDGLILAMDGRQMSAGQITRMAQYRDLMEQITRELRDLEALTRTETRNIAEAAIRLGNEDAARLIAATLTGETMVAANFMKLPNEAIRQLLGFLDPTGPLYKRIAEANSLRVAAIAEAMVDGLTRGIGPRDIAALLTREYGMAIADSLRTVRTANLWAYREASRASMAANRDVVLGWVWTAKLDNDTCMSCVALHGTIHPIDEPMDDHYNGRCTPAPLTPFGNPIEQAGEDWFANLPENQQRSMMEPGKYEAWQAGQFEFSALSKQVENDVYGSMRVETPLKDLVPPDEQ